MIRRLATHTLSIASTSRLTKKIQNPILSNGIGIFAEVQFKFVLVHCHFRLITTQVSATEENVIKSLVHFVSSANDETVSRKKLYSSYIEKLCESGNIADAVLVLKHLRDRNIHVDINSYNIVLATLCKDDQFDVFSEIFRTLLLSRLPPDSTSYDSVAKALCKASEPDLLKFIGEVAEITFNRDPTVINRIIFVAAESGQITKSTKIFEVMKNLNLKMDTVTFNTVLACLGRAGQVDKMLAEFSSMKDLGYIPDAITYNTLVNCLRRLGRLELCKLFAQEMLDKGFEMDLQTYTALIDVLGRAGHVRDAMRMFDELKKLHNPSIYVYRSLISNLKKAGKFDIALDLWEEMNSPNSKLIGPKDFKEKKKWKRNR
ncbi:pentatricopeptide repeat-containing protein At1g11900 [Dioscorea cayenensis subsp. rotundata]|uniref:Pentatricopeptide repeat-containing protein At1g11900 n=1 Tax=Dioscorea cayennensis subsp. rotundata TaxID=55577 RepID=A0AB40C0E7_DIOCR|nr:pentatricopeptide repeat-containing protein At1g11900 [Dioscorea cayenensis subsp. rotundata]